MHINTERTWRGGERQTLYLLEGLRARGDEALLVAQAGSPLAERAGEAGIPLEEIRGRGDIAPGATLKIRKLCAEHRPDLIHLHTGHAHMLGLLATLGRGVPRVVSRRVALRPGKNPLSLAKYRLGVDRYIAISSAVKRALLEIGVPEAKITVVPDGIDVGRFESASGARIRSEFAWDASHFVVANVGTISETKGHPEMYEAAVDVVERCERARFLFVGEGKLLDSLREKARGAGLAERVVFTGFREDIPDVIAACDLFVTASRHEGLGTSILEAMGLGKPVVATAVGGIPEIVREGETGVLIPSGESGALVEAVLLMEADQARREGYGAAGRELVSRSYTVDAMVEGTMRVYADLLGRAAR